MMAGNPNWWSLNESSSAADDDHLHNHGYPVPWTQLLVGRLATEQEERLSSTSCDSDLDNRRKQLDQKSSISDDAQITSSYGRNYSSRVAFDNDHVKQEMKEQSINQQEELYSTSDETNHKDHDHPWSSCFTGGSNHINYLDFSRDRKRNQHQVLDQYASLQQCNDTVVPSGTSKKARVQPSSTQQPALKVRKEKLGDRITALHQLVSPFGKTDTASVLLEAMGYIRFLEAQVQALSSAYLGNASTGSMRIPQSVNDELTTVKDLRSIGLSLVPVDYALHINNTIGIDNNNINNGADYWASSSL
ncbi:transcription factor bHLH68 [Daucus carota subsp. sativus]|uniref:transcription factor bHLH68 n=1 Tax=Daucus carota subsp. sativus TaxID=79200 RepID=UPI0007F00703|nr:PREDICTED: transcription factor bHLH68-like [Daucus carota subsp. sativus]